MQCNDKTKQKKFTGSWEKGPVVAAHGVGGASVTGLYKEGPVAATPSQASKVGAGAGGVGAAGGMKNSTVTAAACPAPKAAAASCLTYTACTA
jgi:hypothetical protein